MVFDIAEQLQLKIDIMKAVKMALVHNLGEYFRSEDIVAPDIRSGKVSSSDKFQEEDRAMQEIINLTNRNDIYQLWLEYEQNETDEAKYVRAMVSIEATLPIMNRRWKLESPDMVAPHCDESVANFQYLLPFYLNIREKLKEWFLEDSYGWNEEWDNQFQKSCEGKGHSKTYKL